MRSNYYVATVISCYRRLIDAYYNNTLTKDLENKEIKALDRVANRESTTQYYKGEVTTNDQYYIGREEVSNQDFLGLIIGYDHNNKMVILEERNFFKPKDKVNIFTPNGEEYSFTITKIYNENIEELECARHPKEIIKIPFEKELPKNSMMRIDFF